MKRHYLHLSVYRCEKCQGPVVTGSLAVRENEISSETEKREMGRSASLATPDKAKPQMERKPVT